MLPKVPPARYRLRSDSAFGNLSRRVVHRVASFSAAGVMANGDLSYPVRVRQVLSHIEQHPLELQSTPMEYERNPMKPLPSVIDGLTLADLGGQAHQLDWARVAAALLYLACGGLDQAHNLVTPLCRGSYTEYAGPPIRGSPAAKEAAYVHALIHRQEGECEGEFGTGWSNANYWYAAAREHAIYPSLLQYAAGLAAEDSAFQPFVRNLGSKWDPYKFVHLCKQSYQDKDAATLSFCTALINKEWRLLFDYCFSKVLSGDEL